MIKPFLIFDFDRTIADTFAPSPSGIGVEEASALAVKDVFGNNMFEIYVHTGGLKNREPSELVSDLNRTGREKGINLHGQSSDQETTEHYVAAKISYLLQDISPNWPKLYQGVEEFFHKVAEGQLNADVAIVSSGHNEAIKKIFCVNGMPLPELMITSDAIRNLLQPQRPKYKPHPYQLARIHKEWLGKNALKNQLDGNYTGRSHGKPSMMYFGDDPVKDGGLAEKSRILFGFVPFARPDFWPDERKGQVLIPDFNFLIDVLQNQGHSLREGRSLSEVFLGRPDHEIFPPLAERERPYVKWTEERTLMFTGKERY